MCKKELSSLKTNVGVILVSPEQVLKLLGPDNEKCLGHKVEVLGWKIKKTQDDSHWLRLSYRPKNISRSTVCLHFSRYQKTNDHKIERKRKTYSYNIVLCPHYSFEESFIQKIYATLSIIMNILFFRNKKKSSCNIINCYILLLYQKINHLLFEYTNRKFYPQIEKNFHINICLYYMLDTTIVG